MKQPVLLALAACALLAAAPIAGVAQGKRGNFTDMPGAAQGDVAALRERLLAEIEALGLDATQRAALQKLGDSYRTRAEGLRERAAAIREQMLQVEPDDPRYGDLTERASVATGELAADGARLAADFRADVFSILTPEQRQRLRERASERSKPWDDWRSRHRAGSGSSPP